MKRENLEFVKPGEIEKRSFEILTKELKEKYGIVLPNNIAPVVKRVIHTTADFEFANTLKFSENAVEKGIEAIKTGVTIVTDTNMALSGINKTRLQSFGGNAMCHMSDADVAEEAKIRGITRASVSMEKTVEEETDGFIYAIGNAPTALVTLYDLIKEDKLHPKLIIGVPVGFVNVVEAKELIMDLDVPYIVAEGRRGGSNIAAAICNALIYEASSI